MAKIKGKFINLGTGLSVSGDNAIIDLGSNLSVTGVWTFGADNLQVTSAPDSADDVANKAYVDSLAAGLDPKESCRFATLAPIIGTYAAGGGTGGTGAFTVADITDVGDFDLDGNTAIVGDRILIKDQADAKQNGIYVVTVAGAGATSTIERSADQDGSPAAEVSSGNYTFIEVGATYTGTGHVTTGDGLLTLNTDNVDWVQYSGAGTNTVSAGATLTDNAIIKGAGSKAVQASAWSIADTSELMSAGGNLSMGTNDVLMADDQDIIFGTDSNSTLGYDETTNDDLTLVVDAAATGDGAFRIDGQVYSVPTTLSDTATVATDCNDSNFFELTLTGTATSLGVPTNLKDGASYVWRLIQDGTGSRTLPMNAVFKFSGGAAPSLSTTPGAVDILTGVSDGTNIHADIRVQDGVSHASTHLLGGTDEMDGDKLGIDFTPTNYTPTLVGGVSDDLDQLTSHLKGLDLEIAGISTENVTVEYHLITTAENAGGTFTIASTPVNVNSVRISPDGGPLQVNDALKVGAQVADYSVSGTTVTFNGGALSGDLGTGDILMIVYQV